MLSIFISDLHPFCMRLVGKAETGIKRGAYYVEKFSDRFRDKLGYIPFPGTLNIRLVPEGDAVDRGELEGRGNITISPFEKEGEAFVRVRCYPCIINGKIFGSVVVPDRTDHPPEVIELVAKVNIRDALGIEDGDRVEVELA